MAKKVFLSPSDQFSNKYAYGNTTEGVQCGKIANYCKAALERSGVDVMLMHDKSMSEKCAASNKFGADLHVPIHTNAFNGVVMGTRMFCYNSTGKGMSACKAIFSELAPISPGKSENIQVNDDLYEVRVPDAPTAYIECEFHDTKAGAKWIVENTEKIGEAIAKGICKYLGVTFKAKPQTKPNNTGATIYRVQVGAYTKKENAENMLTKLKKDGYSGFIVEGKL